MKKSIVFVLMLMFVLPALGACGGTDGVPDNLAIELVGECKYADSDYLMSTDVKHCYDSDSHLDYATLITKAEWNYGSFVSTCDAVFQYDRSSDLWSLFRAEEWTQPTYTYTDSLIGTWNVGNSFGGEDESYKIEILRVDDNEIQLNYSISNEVYGGLFVGDVMLEMSGSATVSDPSKWIIIPIELPKGFRAGSSQTTKLWIHLDIADGVTSAYIEGILTYVG